MSEAAAFRPRNRALTETRILEAARQIIARDGFAALGVNVLAAEAGCDKKLITRYFGGLDGVVAVLGGEAGFWVGAPTPTGAGGDYADRMVALLELYREHLDANPLLLRMLGAELIAASPILAEMEQARSVAIGQWMAKARGDLKPPEGVDAPAINAVILAALHYLALRGQTLNSFAGIDLSSETGRQRINKAMAMILRKTLKE